MFLPIALVGILSLGIISGTESAPVKIKFSVEGGSSVYASLVGVSDLSFEYDSSVVQNAFPIEGVIVSLVHGVLVSTPVNVGGVFDSDPFTRNKAAPNDAIVPLLAAKFRDFLPSLDLVHGERARENGGDAFLVVRDEKLSDCIPGCRRRCQREVAQDNPWSMRGVEFFAGNTVLVPSDHDQPPSEKRKHGGEKGRGGSRSGHNPIGDLNLLGIRLLGGLFGGGALFGVGLVVGLGDGLRRLNWGRRFLGFLLGVLGLTLIAYGWFWTIWNASS